MTRLFKHWKRWAALGAAFLLVLLLWLALVAGRVAGETLQLALRGDSLPIDQAAAALQTKGLASRKAPGEGT